MLEEKRKQGHLQVLMNEMRAADSQSIFNFLWIEPALVRRLGPRIRKTDANLRKALSPGLNIAVAVRFLV